MYTGTLVLEQLAGGRLKALRNAEELLSDARSLSAEQRWPRVLLLSQIAVEEAGKYFYLLASCMMLADGSIKWPRFWKAIRSHSDKTILFLLMEQMLLPGPGPLRRSQELQTDARTLDRAKMWALYADYEQKEFFAPAEVIGESLAKQALDLAHNRVRLAREFESTNDWSNTLLNLTPDKVAAMKAILKEELEAMVRHSEADSHDA
jgi:AbiV family abortive infection protein